MARRRPLALDLQGGTPVALFCLRLSFQLIVLQQNRLVPRALVQWSQLRAFLGRRSCCCSRTPVVLALGGNSLDPWRQHLPERPSVLISNISVLSSKLPNNRYLIARFPWRILHEYSAAVFCLPLTYLLDELVVLDLLIHR